MHPFLTASVEIFRIRRAGLRVHLSFAALAAVLILADPTAAGAGRACAALGLLLAAALLQAAGSALAARLAGAAAETPLLWPLGNLAGDPAPRTPLATAAAAAGGWVALAGGHAFALFLGSVQGARAAALLFLASLIPASPFAAGRVLRAWFLARHGGEAGGRLSVSTGFAAAVAVCVVGTFLIQPELAALALFLAFWTAGEWREEEARREREGAWPDVEEEAGAFDPVPRSAPPAPRRAAPAVWTLLARRVAARRRRRRRERDARLRSRVDALLEKLSRAGGLAGLSRRERWELVRASRSFKRMLARAEPADGPGRDA